MREEFFARQGRRQEKLMGITKQTGFSYKSFYPWLKSLDKVKMRILTFPTVFCLCSGNVKSLLPEN
jgi:hypothetical protein